ncbi:MAG: glycosyltransferase [Chromatiales bacterium]|nr:glycosyltransferase [Chromatiales bacterium]
MPADQIIAVDDGSSDETPRILDEYKGRIEPIIQQNTGKPQALNKAFEQGLGGTFWIFRCSISMPVVVCLTLAIRN